MHSMRCKVRFIKWDAYDKMHILRWIELNECNRCIKWNAWLHNELNSYKIKEKEKDNEMQLDECFIHRRRWEKSPTTIYG